MLRFAERNPQIPPRDLTPIQEIAEAFERWTNANTAANLAVQTVDELRRERVKAERQDDQATADALEQGLKDPGPKHVAALDRRLEEAQRKARASLIVQRRANDALQQAHAEHGAAWTGHLHRMLDEARQSYRQALQAVQETQSHLSQVENAVAFAEGASTFDQRKWRKHIPSPQPVDGPGFGFLSIDATIEALATLAEPPETPEKPKPTAPRPWSMGNPMSGTEAEFQRRAAQQLAGEAAGAMLAIPTTGDED